ncbi:MAG: 50S ribosomal protein L12 [Promethearchaeota archaeon]
MESIYAALLLHKAEKKITEANLEKVLTAAGAKVDKTEIAKLITGLKGADIDKIIKSTSTMPVMASPSEKPAKKKIEEKEKKEEVEEEPTGIGSLF